MSGSKTLILFDAVGTLIRPMPCVVEIYHDAGQQAGSRLTTEQVATRFAESRRRFFRQDANGFVSSDQIERELWRRLVFEVFDDATDCELLFSELWQRFSEAGAWAKFEDTDSCLSQLKQGGFDVAIGSNFDSRLLPICESLFAENTFDGVFCSSRIGFRKPAEAFYERIEKRYPEHRIVMVGDDPENDFHAPRSFGWQAILLDRKGQHDEHLRIRNLAELAERLRQ